MTFSIIARCNRSGMFGIGIATRPMAIGAKCPFLRAGIGGLVVHTPSDPQNQSFYCVDQSTGREVWNKPRGNGMYLAGVHDGRIVAQGTEAELASGRNAVELVVRGATFAAAGTAGQRCTTLRRVIVHSSRLDEVVVTGSAVRVIVSARVPAPLGRITGERTIRMRAAAAAMTPTRL